MIKVECPKCEKVEFLEYDNFWIKEQEGFLKKIICSRCFLKFNIWVKKGIFKIEV